MGVFRIETCIRPRHCKHCLEVIPADTTILVYRHRGYGQNLCSACIDNFVFSIARLTAIRNQGNRGETTLESAEAELNERLEQLASEDEIDDESGHHAEPEWQRAGGAAVRGVINTATEIALRDAGVEINNRLMEAARQTNRVIHELTEPVTIRTNFNREGRWVIPSRTLVNQTREEVRHSGDSDSNPEGERS